MHNIINRYYFSALIFFVKRISMLRKFIFKTGFLPLIFFKTVMFYDNIFAHIVTIGGNNDTSKNHIFLFFMVMADFIL